MQVRTFAFIALGVIVLSALAVAFYPRGIRNNNPGNIKRTADVWLGQSPVQTDSTFVQFTHPKYGFRAMTRILRNYQRRGLVTLDQIISTYAPKSENDTQGYIKALEKRLSIKANQPIDLNRYLQPLLKAIAIQENGFIANTLYSDALIKEGIDLE